MRQGPALTLYMGELLGGVVGWMSLNGLNLVQQCLDGWTIPRADADMMQMDGSARVDQHISATLEDVPFGLP